MKKFITSLFMMGTVAFLSAQTISFDKTTWDYGTVKAGADGHRFFTVTNNGDKPLIISEVKPSCGCTTPEWSKDPILPGKTAQIKVGYNTSIKGAFNKLIEVYSNDPQNSRTVLYIKGTVEGDSAAAPTVTNVTAAPAVAPSRVSAADAKSIRLTATPQGASAVQAVPAAKVEAKKAASTTTK